MWWFSDYDGTINLNHDDSIDSRDLAWINKWKKSNKFAVATGRILPDALVLFEKTKLDYNYLICCNGAVVYKNENNKLKLLKNVSIAKEGRKELLEIFEELKEEVVMSLSVLDKRYDYSVGTKPDELHSNPFFKGTLPIKDNFEEGREIILNSKDLNIAYLFVEEAKAEYYKKLLNSRLTFSKAILTHRNVIEIVDKNVSKAYGIKQVMEIEKFSLDDLITSGDGENDIEMLEMTKFSFAMKNHQKNVDKHAKYIISNVHEIEDILKKLGVNYE